MRTLIAFIAITGNPGKEQMEKMMCGYRKQNIMDVMIYPRTGLEVEYMSKEWLDLVGYCVDYARKNDMRIWLYDELNWPSGTCNKQVFYTNDSYYGKKFYVENNRVEVGQYGFEFDKSVWPFSDCKNDLSDVLDDVDRYFVRQLDPETGNVISVKHGKEIPKSQRYLPLDILNKQAIECFLHLTHEKYFERFGDDFGKTIPGIFTDEPSFRHILSPIYDKRPQYPYYAGICSDYRKAYGSELMQDMLAFENGKTINNFSENFWSLIGKRFKESFMQPIYDWCDSHNLQYTGHMVCDDSINDSVLVSGDILDILDSFHIPGVDEIYTKISYTESFLGLPSSVGATSDFLLSQLQNKRANGKQNAMVELFALGPYNLSAAQKKRAVWYSAAYGVNHYFIGMGHMDAKGNYTRNEYFINSSYATPDVDSLKEVADAAALAIPYADKTPDAIISLRYPLEATLHNLDHFTADYDVMFKSCVEWLGKHQIQWKMIANNEKSDTKHTIVFKDAGVAIEESGAYFKSPEECMESISSQLQRKITVTETSGALAHNVFVRVFTDGSFIVINRNDYPGSERNLIIENNGVKKIFRLFDYGVYTGEKQPTVNTVTELIPENVRIDCNGNKNYFRCNTFGGQCYSFTTSDNFTTKLHIRTYPEKLDVYVDGEKIDYCEPETDFTSCFNGLYTISESICFEKGKHTITIPDNDCAFLPVLIMEGDIDCAEDDSVWGGKILSEGCTEHNPDKPYYFHKTASLHFDVTLPKNSNGASIVLDDSLSLVELIINGKTVDKKACAPYLFTIPNSFDGQSVHCEIKYYGTYQAMFGKVEEIEKKTEIRADWVKLSPISSRNESISMNGLRIFAGEKI